MGNKSRELGRRAQRTWSQGHPTHDSCLFASSSEIHAVTYVRFLFLSIKKPTILLTSSQSHEDVVTSIWEYLVVAI
jgi:hypothetical protein